MSVTLTRGTETDFRIPWDGAAPENLESITATVDLYASTSSDAEPSFTFPAERITLDATGATVDVQTADYESLPASAYLLELVLDYGDGFTTKPLPPTVLYIGRHGSPSPVLELGLAGGQIPGPPGPGVPTGGTDGQVLTKTSSTDYATAWEDPSGGGGGGVNWGNLHAHATANMVFGNAIAEPAVLMFLGDSITDDGQWDQRFLERVAREHTPDTAATFAKIDYDADPWVRPVTAGVFGYDAAVGGAQATTYMRSGLVPIAAGDLQPQVIFHGIGTNDHLQNIAPATTTSAVDAAILSLDAVLTLPAIHVIWVGATMVQTGKTYTWAQRVDALKAAADIDPARRVLIDLGPYFDALGAATPADDWWTLSGDGIHIGDRGQRLLAELMHRALHGTPPVGVIGPAASPALPYSGTTTTTTTAATTTTTTTAGTTTTTTTAAGTTTTTTTAATTTTTTTAAGIVDTFNRADSTTGLGVTDTGQTWIVTGSPGIIDGKAYRVTGSWAVGVVETGMTDLRVQVTITTTAGFSGSPKLRQSVDGTTFYSADVQSNGTSFKLTKTVAGVFTSLGSVYSFVAGDTIGISTHESGGQTVLRIWVNGVAQQTVNDTAADRPMGTIAGVTLSNLGVLRVDYFEATPYTG